MRADCTCTWKKLRGGGKYMAYRDAACCAHGDDTAWWKQVLAVAEDLAKRRFDD